MANSSDTAKQQAVRVALSANPREKGEVKIRYCKRIAGMARVHFGSVERMLDMQECARIGAVARAREAQEAKTRLVPYTAGVGPVTNFRGWLEFFSKLKMLAEAYLLLAQSNGDAYATAYLKDVRDISDRVATRAAISKMS